MDRAVSATVVIKMIAGSHELPLDLETKCSVTNIGSMCIPVHCAHRTEVLSYATVSLHAQRILLNSWPFANTRSESAILTLCKRYCLKGMKCLIRCRQTAVIMCCLFISATLYPRLYVTWYWKPVSDYFYEYVLMQS